MGSLPSNMYHVTASCKRPIDKLKALGCKQSRSQSPQAFWPAVGRGSIETSWEIEKNLNLLIGCSVTACIVLAQKLPVPHSLSWQPTAGQGA